MFRKTLTTLSLIGLLLCMGLWGASYWDLKYVDGGLNVWLKSGRLSFFGGWPLQQQLEWSVNVELMQQVRRRPWLQEGYNGTIGQMLANKQKWAFFGFEDFRTQWWTDRWPWPLSPIGATHVPLWIPSALFAGVLGPTCVGCHRRRKRKKLGLCVKCGYNLKGLTEPRCPECGTSFGETMMFSRRRVFVPRFSGELEFRALPDDLVAALESRIQEGFLVRGNHARSNYRICSSSNDSVTISADDWWTAINVGLNEVKLRREGDQRITFEVSFWRWTTYAAMLGMLIFVVLLGACVFTDWMRPWLSQNRLETLGACSVGIFFCLCWPWILTEFHKKPAARCLERILHETFTDAA